MAGNLSAAIRCEKLLGGDLWHLFDPASILLCKNFKIFEFFNYQQFRSCPLAVPIDTCYFVFCNGNG